MIGTILRLALEERGELIKGDGTVVVFTEAEKKEMRQEIEVYSLDQRRKTEKTLSRFKSNGDRHPAQ